MRTSGLKELRDARDKLVELSRVYYAPNLDVEDFVKAALPLGNRNTPLAEQAECYQFVHHGDHIDAATNMYTELDDGFSTEDEVKRQVTEFWKCTANDRNDFRRMLDRLSRGKTEDVSEVSKYVESVLDEIVLVAQASWEGTSLNLTNRYCLLGVQGAIGYALILLLDGSTEPKKFLKKCKLKSCGDFFWARTSGRPRKYCRPNHKTKADAITAPERTAKSRRKRKSI